ncbi:MAG TPA: hypothetical protein VGQ09_16260 [Chitinophagaceae bacterium]|jgi:hypothetical protein|nr:hypothetical protein [Chitinophagaceae bacterium]
MKNFRAILFFSAILFMTSCSVKVFSKQQTGHLPPGQAKKITGSQSARAYAPGHNKH